MKNVHKLKVYFGDTDAAGIVFYPNYYRWMDQATFELIEKAIMNPKELRTEKNITYPLLETGCKHFAPLFDGDIVEIHSHVSEIRNKVFKVQHEFKKNGEVIASGFEIHAWTSIKDGKLKAIPIPDDIRAAFGHPVQTV